MARINIQDICNVVTEEHSEAYRSEAQPIPRPQVTIPRFRARLSIEEANRLAQALTEAVRVAQEQAKVNQ
jgi:hypothetical protein